MNWREEQERESDEYVETHGYDRIELEKVESEFKENKLDEYEAKIAELKKKIELMKCCGNCKYNSRRFVNNGCNGNCVNIDDSETWQDWQLKTD